MGRGFGLDVDEPLSIGAAISAGNTVGGIVSRPDVGASLPKLEDSGINAAQPFSGAYAAEQPKPSILETLSAAYHEGFWQKGLENEKQHVFGPTRHVLYEEDRKLSDAENAARLEQSMKDYKGMPDEPNFDPFESPTAKSLPPEALSHIDGIKSEAQLQAFAYQHEQEKRNNEVLANSGSTGFFAQLAVGMIDPSFAPAFAPARGATMLARVGNMTANGFLASSSAALGGYAMSTNRTVYDVAGEIAIGTLLIGVTGGLLAHDPIKLEAKRVAGYDAMDAAHKLGERVKSGAEAADPIGSGVGITKDSIKRHLAERDAAGDFGSEKYDFGSGTKTTYDHTIAADMIDLMPDKLFDDLNFAIMKGDISGEIGNIKTNFAGDHSKLSGFYDMINDRVRISVENARANFQPWQGDASEAIGQAIVHEIFHRAVSFTVEAERAQFVKIWRSSLPAGSVMRGEFDRVIKEAVDADVLRPTIDNFKYALSLNESFVNNGMMYIRRVLTGDHIPGKYASDEFKYFDKMVLKAKALIGSAPEEYKIEAANRFYDSFLNRLRADSAGLPGADVRQAIFDDLEKYGRDYLVRMLTESISRVSKQEGYSDIDGKIRAAYTVDDGSIQAMRASEAFKRVDDFLDSDLLTVKNSSIASTGIGLEKWNWSPWHWAMGSPSETVRNLMERLVASPGLKLTKNMSMDAHGNPMTPQPMVRSVETAVNVNWRPKLAEGLQVLREGWLESRGASVDNPNVSSLKLGASDLLNKATGQKAGVSFDEFKGEVSRAMFGFDKHSDPYVAAAAAKLRPIFDEIGESAAKEGVFSWEQRRLLRELTNDLERELGLHRSESFGLTEDRVIKVTDHSPTPHALELDKQIKELKVEIARIDGGGWKTDAQVKGESWFPKLLDRQTILRDPETYKGIVRSYLKSIGVTGDELEKAVVAHFDKVTQRKGYIDFFDDPINAPRSAKAREWQMPAHMVMNYIDTDVERILHRYVSQMGAAIEMSRSFEGHLDMKPMMDKIKLDYDAALKEAGGEVSALERLNKQYVEDKKALLAVRDMIFGVHNIPSDPDALHTRAIRSFKVLNAATLLGGVVLSSLSDVARPVMTEGLSKTMRYGIDAFMMDRKLWALQQAELHATGIANELWTHTRAASFSNWNEIYYNGSKLERGIEKIGNVFSMASGLSQWTDYAKTIAGTVIGNRILDDCLLYAEGKLSPKAMEDLARGGIGEKQAKAIAKMVREHGDMVTKEGWLSDAIGDKPFDTYMASMREKGGSLLANADAWVDAEARMAFRGALYEDVNRAVVTPHIADRPLWMSTELGGLLGQFKAFGMSSTQRVLMAGLQDRDAKFWNGMAMMTAAGMFANATKDAIQRNENWFERKWQDKLIDGMDRSGLLGSFGDINNLLERATENKISFNALLGDNEPKHTSAVAKWGALGPTPQQIARGFAMVGDLGRGEFGDAGANFRRLMPLQGLFYLQPGIHALQGMSHMVDGPSYGVGVGHESLQPYEVSPNLVH